MTENRCRLARERAGLSVGQAAKLLGISRETVEDFEDPSVQLAEVTARQLADLYAVNVEWLTGQSKQYDYESIAQMQICGLGPDGLSAHDRDILAEFAASMPRRKIDP